jgi:hypothetical protein
LVRTRLVRVAPTIAVAVVALAVSLWVVAALAAPWAFWLIFAAVAVGVRLVARVASPWVVAWAVIVAIAATGVSLSYYLEGHT